LYSAAFAPGSGRRDHVTVGVGKPCRESGRSTNQIDFKE
jgi:hypothetical protein